MPTIIVEGPPLGDIEKKRKLVAEMSASASAAYGLPLDAMVVLLKESQPENVGVGGRLLVDRKK
jgi:4-oxalocrotonate tautomerase